MMTLVAFASTVPTPYTAGGSTFSSANRRQPSGAAPRVTPNVGVDQGLRRLSRIEEQLLEPVCRPRNSRQFSIFRFTMASPRS